MLSGVVMRFWIKLIQEVFTNENANIDELVKTANNDFQVNHLDKMD